MKNFMPDFTCMVLQSVIQEKAFLKINFLIAMTSNIFNTQILLNLNFNEIKFCSKPNHFPINGLCTAGFGPKKIFLGLGL